MCKFKSGIILKSGKVLLSETSDSHSDILSDSNIVDNTREADKKIFARFEYVPEGELWEFDKYKLNIDEEVVPDWLDVRSERKIIKATDKWLKDHILYNQKLKCLEDKKGLYH